MTGEGTDSGPGLKGSRWSYRLSLGMAACIKESSRTFVRCIPVVEAVACAGRRRETEWGTSIFNLSLTTFKVLAEANAICNI